MIAHCNFFELSHWHSHAHMHELISCISGASDHRSQMPLIGRQGSAFCSTSGGNVEAACLVLVLFSLKFGFVTFSTHLHQRQRSRSLQHPHPHLRLCLTPAPSPTPTLMPSPALPPTPLLTPNYFCSGTPLSMPFPACNCRCALTQSLVDITSRIPSPVICTNIFTSFQA